MAGVYGESANRGVLGVSTSGDGAFGQATTGRGVVAVSESHVGVDAFCRTGTGVFGNTETGIGVHGKGGRLVGFFQEDAEVTGDIRLLHADCAEDFDVVVAESERIEPGTVMVIKHESTLRPSQQAYDKRVAGVISGAGNCRPGIVLDKQAARENRMPLALMGKVYCKVDAQYAPIEVGDLLTTSPTPGHAMKADDPFKAFGSVIGKALRPLEAGQGLIPILIALQ
jgi:hypothetical protein